MEAPTGAGNIDSDVSRRWAREDSVVSAKLNLVLVEIDDPQVRRRVKDLVKEARQHSWNGGYDTGHAHAVGE